MHTHSFALRITLVLFCGILLAPVATSAQSGTPDCAGQGKCGIGTLCTSDSQCASRECETSNKPDKNGRKMAFCVCGELDTRNVPFTTDSSPSCQAEYKTGVPEDWVCVDGSDATFNLNYCLNTRTNENKPPITPGSASFLDSVLDTGLLADEIAAQINAPQPRINIPGVSFTDGDTVKSYTRVESDGRTYLYIPYLGEYLAAIYRYAIIVAGILAVVYIIAHGFKIIMSGGGSEEIQLSKTRIAQVITGLLLAVGSYVILYTINPELVRFRNLRVLYVPQEDVAVEEEADETSYTQFTPAHVGVPSWKPGEFICGKKEQYPAAGIADKAGLITYDCPVGVIGSVTSVPEMKEPLCKVGRLLAAQGYGMRITSSYRPFQDQVRLWCDDTGDRGAAKKYPDPAERKKWVATPGYSNHGHGIAVDAHLTKDGQQVWKGTPEGQCNADPAQVKILADAFYEADPQFNRYSNEIWHFEYGSGAKSTMGHFTEIMAAKCK